MKLETFLSEKRSKILKHWFNHILETYSPDTRLFLKSQKDRFANPVGTTLAEETENLFHELLRDDALERERVSPILDKIIKIRATQDFTPSQAIAFIFFIKQSVRTYLKNEIDGNALSNDLVQFESKIDHLALIAFDIYMKNREQLYEIKANHAKNQVSGLLRRAGLICEIPEGRFESQEGIS
jgi:hypothetical protein